MVVSFCHVCLSVFIQASFMTSPTHTKLRFMLLVLCPRWLPVSCFPSHSLCHHLITSTGRDKIQSQRESKAIGSSFQEIPKLLSQKGLQASVPVGHRLQETFLALHKASQLTPCIGFLTCQREFQWQRLEV